jgi:hypothetical protein
MPTTSRSPASCSAPRPDHQRLGTTAEFDAYRTALRHDQRRERNLMKILDQHGLRHHGIQVTDPA